MDELVIVGLIITAAFAALGLVFLIVGTIRHRMVRGWVRTTGQVVTRGGRTTGIARPYPTFRWWDSDGREHRRTSMVHSSLGPAPGATVPVRYHPAAPHRGMIDTFVQRGTVFIVLGGVALGIAGLVAAAILALATVVG